MRLFAISNDDTITAFSAAGQIPEGQEQFASEKELVKLSANWPADRLAQVWNSFAGVAGFGADLKPVKKFTDRKTAAARIWKAIQTLDGAPLEVTSTAQETAGGAPKAAKGATKKAKATKAARTKDGASEAREGSKKAIVLDLLRRKDGATLAEISQSHRLAEPLCRRPDYADLCWQPGLWGGDRCDGVGIIREPRGRRAVCRSVGNGRVLSLSELSCPERVP